MPPLMPSESFSNGCGREGLADTQVSRMNLLELPLEVPSCSPLHGVLGKVLRVVIQILGRILPGEAHKRILRHREMQVSALETHADILDPGHALPDRFWRYGNRHMNPSPVPP